MVGVRQMCALQLGFAHAGPASTPGWLHGSAREQEGYLQSLAFKLNA